MQKSILAIILWGLLSGAKAQVTSSVNCPSNVQVQPNFDLKAYLGVWYEYAKYPVFYEVGGKCNQANYTLRDDGNIGVNNSMINVRTNVGSFTIGYAVPAENAKFKVIFPQSRPNNLTSNYWVLSTDYTSYAVVYFCHNADNGTNTIRAWILARQRAPSAETIATAKDIFTKNGISLKELEVSEQIDC